MPVPLLGETEMTRKSLGGGGEHGAGRELGLGLTPEGRSKEASSFWEVRKRDGKHMLSEQGH